MANMRNLVDQPKSHRLLVSQMKQSLKRTLKRPITSVVGMFKELTEINAKGMNTSTKQVPLDFPGDARVVVAQEALDHLERNLPTFEKIFEQFNIQKSDYRLLAGFDEDLLRGQLRFVNQIHIFLLSEPPNIEFFLSSLSPALGGFSAFVFTDKSKYCIPSSTRPDYKTALELPTWVSTLSQGAGDVSQTFGGSDVPGQSSNGGDGSRRKGKEREPEKPDQNDLPDSGKGTNSGAEPGSPGPDDDDTHWDAEVSFQVISRLHQYAQPRENDALRPEPFQIIQVQGTVKTKRTSESQDPRRFAICETEFSDLLTTGKVPTTSTNPGPTYCHSQLDVRIDAKKMHFTRITKIRPLSTQKYNPESKITNGTKDAWNAVVSASISLVKPLLLASGSRTGEKSTAIEKTARVSRIIQRHVGPEISWTFHINDPFDQEVGFTLSPEKLPCAHFQFRGTNPPPPPEHLSIEIFTHWSLLSSDHESGSGGGVWLTSESAPSFSNLCKIITLNLPSHLRGSHCYDADFLVWPKHSNLGSTTTRLEVKLEEGVKGLVKARVVDTDSNHNIVTPT